MKIKYYHISCLIIMFFSSAAISGEKVSTLVSYIKRTKKASEDNAEAI